MEILFRGKSKETGKWVEGYYVAYEKETYIFEQAEVNKGIDFGGYLDCCKMSEVVPETVGRYTGLTDKNGKKIFEGDIVDCWSEGVQAQGTVQQRRDGLWIIYPACQKIIMWGLCPDEYSNTTVEVVGNIYDNPELLN